MALDEREAFLRSGAGCDGEALQCRERIETAREIAHGQLSDDDWMRGNRAPAESLGKRRETLAKVLDPNGGVGKNHLARPAAGLFRAGISRPGMEPPKAANRAAASFSIKASSPILTMAVFSNAPVYSHTLEINASSMFNVVLMHTVMPSLYAFGKVVF